MASNEFILKIEGVDVSPDTVDIGELADVLSLFRSVVVAIADGIGEQSGDVALSLVDIKDGSDKLTLAASPRSLRATSVFVSALATNAVSSLPISSHKSIRALWKSIHSNGWDQCVFIGNGSAIGKGVISSDIELFPDSSTYRGLTTIYGECIRAGGEQRKSAQLKLLDGRSMSIRVKSKTLAIELGHRLYQVVGLSGEAVWSTKDSEMIEFRADELTPYSDRNADGTKRTFIQSLESLASSAGNRWDGIDPDAFIQEQRRD